MRNDWHLDLYLALYGFTPALAALCRCWTDGIKEDK